MDFQYYKSTLERAGVIFEAGLSSEEVQRIETQYDFRFPPDYRAFLMYALPTSHDFIDWRNADEAQIRERLSWPYDSMCFDIEHSNFWLRTWGTRPPELSDAFAIAKQAIEQAPALIPI